MSDQNEPAEGAATQSGEGSAGDSGGSPSESGSETTPAQEWESGHMDTTSIKGRDIELPIWTDVQPRNIKSR